MLDLKMFIFIRLLIFKKLPEAELKETEIIKRKSIESRKKGIQTRY